MRNTHSHIHAIKSVVLDQLDCARYEACTTIRIGDEREVTGLGVCVAADRQQDFEISVGGESAAAKLSMINYHTD